MPGPDGKGFSHGGEECETPPEKGRQNMISNWEPAHSLIGDAVSGAEFAFHLARAVTRLPPYLQRVMGQSAAGNNAPLVFAQSFAL